MALSPGTTMVTQACRRGGGFPSNVFCNQVKSESYHCLVCLEVCRSPVTCQSGAHLFCLDCLTESIRRNPTCPVCREPLTAPLPSAFASAQQKVLAQDSWARWPGSCPRGQGLAQETKILSKRPNLAQDLAQVLRQDPEQDFGSHNLGILDKILGKSWARGGKSWASLRQVVLRKNFLLGAQVSALDVVCIHDKCKWKGTCGRLDGHLDNECAYESITCPTEGCGVLVPRGEMATHQQFVCLQTVPLRGGGRGVSYPGPRGKRGAPRFLKKNLFDNSDCQFKSFSCFMLMCTIRKKFVMKKLYFQMVFGDK